MKKFILTLAMATVATVAFAQFRWGPVAGWNMQKYEFKQELIDVDARSGYSVGVMGELMFPGIGIGMDFGLHYEQHGSRLHFEQREVWSSDGFDAMTSQIHLLQIPINLRFKYTRLNGVEDKVAPFVYGGPVFNVQVGHNSCPPLEYSAGSFGLQCAVGAEIYRHWQVSGGYYWDMTFETRTRKLENFSARPQGWNVKVAYLF